MVFIAVMILKKKKVLIVSSEFPPQPGGIGNHAYHLAIQLSQQGFVVRVMADQRSDDGAEEATFDEILPFKVIRTKKNHPRFLMYLKRLSTLYSEIRRSSQIIATGKFSLWSVGFYSGFLKRHYVAVVHGTEVNFQTFWLKQSITWSLKRFHKIIAVSHYTKSLIAHLGLDLTVIPNGIDFEQWQSSTDGFPQFLKGSPKLITVGNVTSRKGQQNVISHLPLLLKHYPDLHYHAVGLKTEADAFMDLAERLQVEAHLTFHGRVSDEKLKAMLLDSDMFVMLSSTTATGDVEGFGIAILEANAMGLPAIGAKGCGIEDAISNQHSGILIDGGNGNEFLEAIVQLISHKEVYRDRALIWAAEHRWEVIINHYIEVLSSE